MEQIPENKTPEQEAIEYIEMIRQECAMMGANDSEFDRLNQIREALQTRKINPEKAKAEANAIKENKVDYH